MSNRSYLEIYRRDKSLIAEKSKLTGDDEEETNEEEYAIPNIDYNRQYLKIKKENESLQKEILSLQKEIQFQKEKQQDDYDKLEAEIAELCDIKYKENDDLTNEVQNLKMQIAEIEEWTESTDVVDAKIAELTKRDDEITEQEKRFCEELTSATNLLQSVKNKQPSASEMFGSHSRIPKYKEQIEASMMASSLFKLRQSLISYYARNCLTPDCAIQ